MDPVTITCDACGETAFVRNIHYQYDGEHQLGQPADGHRLIQTEWEVECPNCGVRTQVKSHAEA